MSTLVKAQKVSKVVAVKAESLGKAAEEIRFSARDIYRQKMEDAKNAFSLVENEIRAELGTKTITLKNGATKVIEPSKALVKAKANIEHLSSIEGRTIAESKRLIASLSKVDKMSASRVYEYVFGVLNGFVGGENAERMQAIACELLGTTDSSKFPTFKAFASELPVKFNYSESDGWNVLAKLNKGAQQLLKAERQNKATAKK